MGKLVAAYESYLMNIRHASDNTVASYLRDVRQFTTYLEQTDGPALEACTQETVCAYVRHLTSIGKSPATVSRCMATASPPARSRSLLCTISRSRRRKSAFLRF